jgi:hypothetical protein
MDIGWVEKVNKWRVIGGRNGMDCVDEWEMKV